MLFRFASGMAKSLKKRIDELVNELGGSDPPTNTDVRGKLVALGLLVEALEEGAAIRDAEAKAAILETENSNLKTELDALKTEVGAFRAGRKKQEEKDRELPAEQFEILRRLPSIHGGVGLTVLEIWREVKGRLDETEIHVDKLEKAGLIAWHMEADGEKFWRRTMSGNELVVAKRLAGEEDEPQSRYKHTDLPEVEQLILTILKGFKDAAKTFQIAAGLGLHEIQASEDKTEYLLRGLEKKGFATSDDETYQTGTDWFITDKGTEYLAERDLL
jgi:hypothetical protein